MQPGEWVLTSAVLDGSLIVVFGIQSTIPALNVELGNQEYTPCMLTPAEQASQQLMLDLMPTVSEVIYVLLRDSLFLFVFILINCCFILQRTLY